jgi:uncharacterized membrane protein
VSRYATGGEYEDAVPADGAWIVTFPSLSFSAQPTRLRTDCTPGASSSCRWRWGHSRLGSWGLWYRDRMLKATLAVLIGTLTFAFSLLRRIDDAFVPDLGVTLSGCFISLSLLVFIVFFDRYIRRLRPAAVAADVARTACSSFEQTVRFADRTEIRWEYGTVRLAPTLVVRASRGGAIQAVDLDRLVEWARSHGAELVLPHPVGDSCIPAVCLSWSTEASSTVVRQRNSRE